MRTSGQSESRAPNSTAPFSAVLTFGEPIWRGAISAGLTFVRPISARRIWPGAISARLTFVRLISATQS